MASLASRIVKLRVWDAPDGARWKSSVLDMDYQVLLVSQFTLLATVKKNKPDFHNTCPPDVARDMYHALLAKTRELYVTEKNLAAGEGPRRVQDGVFGAMMQVGLINDGPVTFELVTPPKQVAGGKLDKAEKSKKSKQSTPRAAVVSPPLGEPPTGKTLDEKLQHIEGAS